LTEATPMRNLSLLLWSMTAMVHVAEQLHYHACPMHAQAGCL
jgi:hypothetical protein